jgi:hypothetical protein
MSTLKSLMEGYRPGDVPRVTRSGESYQQTYDYFYPQLSELVARYKAHGAHDQTARLIRDDFEKALRRYHEYCIEQNQGAHYIEVGLDSKTKTEFEHVIPVKVVRDAVFCDRMTIDQALNMPSCKLSKVKHDQLANLGLAKESECPYYFWRRYKALGIKIATRSGDPVNLDTWNLDTHYEYFG